jgi:3-hydroxybutyryl-CoA dehydrogenase
MNPSNKLLVVGGGTMGVDIAAAFMAGGWDVTIVEPLVRGHEQRQAHLQSSLRAISAELRRARFISSLAEAELRSSGYRLVIEAVPEKLSLKREVFAILDREVPSEVPLCSNSSAIPISEIGQGLQSVSRMLGTHFFMPAHLVPGVEVVSSVETDPQVAQRVAADLTSAGRVPIMVKRDIPGFLVNRLQHAISREAFYLVDQGIATPEEIDKAVRFGFGFRYLAAGPCLQRDHAGLDVHLAAAESIYPDLNNAATPSTTLRQKVEEGALGMKTGRGFFQWDEERIQKERARYQRLLIAAAEQLAEEIRLAREAQPEARPGMEKSIS